MKIVLVTGIAGFIGFHAAQALHARGDLVIGLDNFNSYYDPELKRKRAAILENLGIKIFEADLNDSQALDYLFTEYHFTDVLHLAAQAGVRYAKKNPKAYLASNIDGFLALLEKLKDFPEVKFTYASSSSVYGRNTKIPFSIDDRTDQPANLYAATKKANELMAYAYHHIYGIRSCGLRFFTVYGPWGRPDMAYYSFSQDIVNRRPIHLFNQGNMKRDFTFIDDIVRGIVAAMDYSYECEVFNLGNNRPVELLTFVSTLEKLLGLDAIKVFENGSFGEVETTYADITASRDKLGFNPVTSLEEGLTKFVVWFQDHVATAQIRL